MLCSDNADCVICFSLTSMYINHSSGFSNVYFSTGARYFVYPWTEWRSLIFRISQNLLYLFKRFENGLNVVLIQYLADMVRCFIYGRMEKVLLPVSSYDGCMLKFIALLVCLLIIFSFSLGNLNTPKRSFIISFICLSL